MSQTEQKHSWSSSRKAMLSSRNGAAAAFACKDAVSQAKNSPHHLQHGPPLTCRTWAASGGSWPALPAAGAWPGGAPATTSTSCPSWVKARAWLQAYTPLPAAGGAWPKWKNGTCVQGRRVRQQMHFRGGFPAGSLMRMRT